MSAHTRGPWFVNGYAVRTLAHGGTRTVAQIVEHTDEAANAANATLIAAAPDMFAALEAIVASWPAHGSEVNNAMADAMAAKAREVLTKIKGSRKPCLSKS